MIFLLSRRHTFACNNNFNLEIFVINLAYLYTFAHIYLDIKKEEGLGCRG